MSIPRITELLSNRARLHTIAITIANAAAAQTDTITIDGVACAFTSDATPTKQEVSNGLIAAIAAASVAGMFEVSQGAAPGYDITLRPVGPFLRPSVAVSANLTDTQSYGLSKLEKDLEDIKADVDTLASTGVPVTAFPGTSEADIAAMKGKIDTMQADLALIKAQDLPPGAVLHELVFDADDLVKSAEIGVAGVIKNLHLIVPNFTNVVTVTLTITNAAGYVLWSSAAKAKNASYNLESESQWIGDQVIMAPFLLTCTLSGAAGGAGGTVGVFARYLGA